MTRINRLGILLIVAMMTVVALAGTSAGQDDVLMDPLQPHPTDACSVPYHVAAAGWNFCWQQDDLRGQGLELNQVYFQEESVLWKIGFPFSITKYENDEFGPYKDTLGESLLFGDNPGFGRGSMSISQFDCPRFYGGTGLLLNDDRICIETREGPEPAVSIWARYDIFNYRFLQGYTLDSRGVIEPFIRLGGTLADGAVGGASGTNHFHHAYWRVDLDIGNSGNDSFQTFLRPDPAWNDWDPYVVWTPDDSTDLAFPVGLNCEDHDASRAPPPCRGESVSGNFTEVDPLAQLPVPCRKQVQDGITGWCGIQQESILSHHPNLFTKWRVSDPEDRNDWGNAKSYESAALTHFNVPFDGEFTSFDAMVLQAKGDSTEVGFEVPARPLQGDDYLQAYLDPQENLTDPVAWFAVHAYHDTRDEEWPTMSYHHISFTIDPRNFVSENPGEDSYNGGSGAPVQPPGGGVPGPGTCIGAVCTP